MKKLPSILTVASLTVSALSTTEAARPRDPNWPQQVTEIKYLSAADSTLQPALFYVPNTDKPVPLLVALHTWSGNYRQKLSIPYAQWCIEKNWVFIHPHFRGPNRNKDATGSELVVADIISAVDHAKTNAKVDPSRIYMIGGSGGGYTSLLMAGRAPHIWAGVSAWVPITDLKAWYVECRALKCNHADDIVKSCGGPPDTDPAVDKEYIKRSPITYLKNAAGVPLDINAGIRDGHHSGGVPISHSLRAFNVLASEKDRIAEQDVIYFTEKAEVPPHLRKELADPIYGLKAPLFRRKTGNARVTIFDGGHDIVYEAGLTWLSKQKKQNTDTAGRD
jgi:dienelactone hydrolase